MSRGIFSPRSSVGRITPNAGNRSFIMGGRGPGRRLPAKAPPVLRAIALAVLLSGMRPVEPPDDDEGRARDDV